MTTTRAPKESAVEAHLVGRCAELGLLCLKFTSPGRRAVPDRIVLGHDADGHSVTLFVEVKRPGEKPRANQAAMIRYLRDHGAHAVVVDSTTAVNELLADWITEPAAAPHERDPHAAPLPSPPRPTPILSL